MPDTKSAASSNDERFLASHGYRQELDRGLSLWSSFSVGFATISPVVGIYSVMSLGAISIGPSWVWIVPLCLALQFTVALVYAELSSQYPLAGGCYQWVRHLVGDRLAWFTGFLYLASALASLTTVSYLGGFWLSLFVTGSPPSADGQVACGAALLALGLAVNLLGINPLKYFVNAGIIAEAIASIGIGVVLLLFFRNHSFDLLFTSMGAEAASDGSYLSGFLTALAVGGWAFLGFDACSQISEETTDARISVPRAILRSMLVVGGTVMLTAFAVTLSYKDPAAVVSGQIIDPVTPAVVDALGAWSERPFVAVVVVAFVACVVSVQTYIGRAIFGMARDGILPGSALLRRVDRRKVPMAAMLCSTVIAAFGLVLGLNATAVGTLIAFGSGGFFFVFLIVTASALVARLNGRWNPAKGAFQLGRWSLPVNIVATLWLVFEAINVAWPRVLLAPPGAPWFQVWAVILVFSALSAFGLLYLAVAKPHRRIPTAASFATTPLP
ncbi:MULTISPECIES: APC family permease [unclassified Shinella]|uniref:APC family permease n=1 Tax=unclassified Shinella TaxID=2643062 RepID=UPI00234EE8E5|nr:MULTISPECIES: APC family permease [unclassified Shinella]MCO5152016.1 APC family permease [Shinella sp.]MDC7266570.1 APC family permease [Shinella sp. HY16]MDC7273467.1 APC family permease [Shinella sp. YZ44]